MTSPERLVLFVCTGNIYRSRFAEAVFNHHAETAAPGWKALSRGLGTGLARVDLAREAAEGLARRAIELRHTGPTRVQISEADLRTAIVLVGMREAEHRPLVTEGFPEFEARFRYWDIADVNETPAEEALAAIEANVRALLAELNAAPREGGW